jgi:ATP-binding cassette, subfamily B (MDR/TAP), member 1
MGITLLMATIAGAAMPLMFLVFGRLVGNFAGYFIPGSGVTKAQFEHQFNQNALYMVYIFIGRFVSGYISMLCVRISGLRISARLRQAYLEALFAQPVSMIDKLSPGKVSTRITSSANTIQNGISQQLALFIQSIVFTVGLYVVAFIKSPILTLVASASLPFIVIAYAIILPFFLKYHKQTENIREEASSLAFEIFTSIRIVVAFGAEDRLYARHNVLLQKAQQVFSKAGPLMGYV